MVGVWVMFGVVIGPVFGSSIPVISKLVLRCTASKPPEAHIHHFGPAGDNCFVGNTDGGGVISLDRSFRLWPSHSDEGLPVGNHFSCGDKKGCKFWFSSWSHNELDDLGNGEYGTIETWKWIILRKEDVSSRLAAGVGLIEKSCIRMGTQDHVTRPVNNAVSWIGSNIVKKEVHCLFSGNGSVWLASGDGTEGYQKFVVDRLGIVKERADNFLNAAFSMFVE